MPLTAAGIKSRALELRFDLCGIARAEVHPRLARLREWIAAGLSGDMEYLATSANERSDPRAVLPTARSVISLAVVYYNEQRRTARQEEDHAGDRAVVSRYAWGDDYHDVLRERLRALIRWMRDAAGPGFEAFSCVDSGPIQERVFAEQAGLGWIGKNTCLINPQLGSWLFLAEVLTNVVLDVDSPALDHCGSCTRCLEACPTGAIVEPYMVDATRCLSYLTIETKGAVDPALRPAIREQIYGCDICQDVCPWNRRAVVSADPAWMPRPNLAFPHLLDLCRLPDDEWRRMLKGSAMRRAGLRRIRRSLAYAAASLTDEHRAIAIEALAAHPSARDPFVADALEWARAQRTQAAGVAEMP
jgi:epoxyqueuosine reductase